MVSRETVSGKDGPAFIPFGAAVICPADDAVRLIICFMYEYFINRLHFYTLHGIVSARNRKGT